jgi:hypothetical protein
MAVRPGRQRTILLVVVYLMGPFRVERRRKGDRKVVKARIFSIDSCELKN